MTKTDHILDTNIVSGLTVGQAVTLIGGLIKSAPRLGDLTVRELTCMSLEEEDPVGIYIFGDENGKILYVGKTHGRSFHERMLSHLDSREPIPGSPHLAQFVSSQVKKDSNLTRSGAVDNILNMRMLWIPVPRQSDLDSYKELVSLVERRLLWSKSLNPVFNSERVKKNTVINLKGKRRKLSLESTLFSLEDSLHVI